MPVLELDIVNACLPVPLPPGLLAHNVNVQVEWIRHNMVLYLTHQLMGKYSPLVEKERVRVPADWWSHLKQTLNTMFGWEFKVKMREIVVRKDTIFNYCPHIDIPTTSTHLNWIYDESRRNSNKAREDVGEKE